MLTVVESRQGSQPQLCKKCIVTLLRLCDVLFDCHQLGVYCAQVDFLFCLGRADITRDVEVVIVVDDLLHRHAAGVAFDRRFRALLRDVLPVHGMGDTDHVLIGREGGIERDFALLREELLAALTRAREGKGDAPRKSRGPRKASPANKPSATGKAVSAKAPRP